MGGREFRFWTVDPAAEDRLIDEAIRDGTSNPYFGRVWPSALALAHFLCEGPELAGRRALELGCGPGVVGVAAALRGAVVTCSDIEPAAIELARRNAEEQGVTIEGACIDLTQDVTLPPGAPRYSLILASDLLYEPWQAGCLVSTLTRLLAPDGEAWIVDPGRSSADHLLEIAAADGFDATEETMTHSYGAPMRRFVVKWSRCE